VQAVSLIQKHVLLKKSYRAHVYIYNEKDMWADLPTHVQEKEKKGQLTQVNILHAIKKSLG
jgi:hypothetical protein